VNLTAMPGARTAMRTVLLIEDDAEVREICAQVLLGEGYVVRAAPDGVSGIAQLDCMPDVIVLDLVMPRMDGWEFMRRLRAVAGHEHTPVLLLTGTSSSGAALAGAQAILRKPFVVEALIRQVADLSP
jgi:two-component system, chemotaxis family, chemotaxis protein CheY